MKKVILFAAVAALALSSCSTISHTASTEKVDTELMNRSTAELKVSDTKITYTFTPNDTYRRAGLKSMKAAAIAKALDANGGGDVLVAPEFEIKMTRGLFKTRVKYITVTGHVGKYVNIHPTTLNEAEVVSTLEHGIVICPKK